MQLRHSVGAGPLVTHDDHDIACQLTRLERLEHSVLRVEYSCGSFDDTMSALHSRNLDHRPAEVATQQLEASVGTERVVHRAQYIRVAADRWCLPPRESFGRQPRFLRVAIHPAARNCLHIGM